MATKVGKEESKDAKAKRIAAEMAAAGGNVTEDTFLQSVAELLDINEKMAALNEVRKKTRKTIKSRGIDLGPLDDTIRKAEWSREEVLEDFRKRTQYARWLGLPTEHSPVDGQTDQEAAQAAYDALGFTAARLLKARDVPQEIPERFHENWLAGFDRGAKTMAKWQPESGRTKPDKVKAQKPDAASEAAFADEDAKARAKREAKEAKTVAPGNEPAFN